MNKEKGFINIILLVIVALAALKYFFDFSIFEFFTSEKGRATWAYIKEILDYLKNAIVALLSYIR